MARKTSPPDSEILGYLPPPPGYDDPFEEPGKRTTIVPSDADDDEGAPFEDEMADPQPPLAVEASSPEVAPPPGPDPRELARRLAEEARAKARSAEPKKSREKAPPPPAPVVAVPSLRPEEPAPEPASKKKRLAERAGGRPLSAEEAIRIAMEREQAEAKARKKSERAAARAAATAVLEDEEDSDIVEAEPRRRRRTADSLPPTPIVAPREPTPRPLPAREVRPPAAPDLEPVAPSEVEAVIARVAPGATVLEIVPLSNPVVFRALWTAHRARAWATKDLPLLATSAVLLDAVDRVPAGHLVAVRALVADRAVAAWVDTSRGVLLGLVEPPEVYLAGL